ncbi:hypothetical protein PVAG01_05804 [Phlyctema vagabunda]|uniref:Uncharacterized protein n=1 Tax=Phlyctema vagabunda TaxID=108571 RepID=A0ABR4PEA9_9HELO
MLTQLNMGPEFAQRLQESFIALLFSMITALFMARSARVPVWLQGVQFVLVFHVAYHAINFLMPPTNMSKLLQGIWSYTVGLVSSLPALHDVCQLHDTELNVFKRFRRDDFVPEMRCIGTIHGQKVLPKTFSVPLSDVASHVLPGSVFVAGYVLRSVCNVLSKLALNIFQQLQESVYLASLTGLEFLEPVVFALAWILRVVGAVAAFFLVLASRLGSGEAAYTSGNFLWVLAALLGILFFHRLLFSNLRQIYRSVRSFGWTTLCLLAIMPVQFIWRILRNWILSPLGIIDYLVESFTEMPAVVEDFLKLFEWISRHCGDVGRSLAYYFGAWRILLNLRIVSDLRTRIKRLEWLLRSAMVRLRDYGNAYRVMDEMLHEAADRELELAQEIRALEEARDTAEAQLKIRTRTHESEIERLELELTGLRRLPNPASPIKAARSRQDVASLVKRLEQKTAEGEVAAETIRQLKQQVADAESKADELTKCREHGAELTQKITDLNKEVSDLQRKDQQERLAKSAASGDDEVTGLVKQIQDLSNDLDQCRAREGNMTQRVTELTKALTEYENDEKTAVSKNYTLTQHLATSRYNENALKDLNRALDARVKDLETHAASASNELEAELAGYKSELLRTRANYAEVVDERERAETQLRTLRGNFTDLEERARELNTKSDRNDAQLVNLRSQLDTSRDLEKRLKDDAAHWKEEIARFEQSVIETQSEVSRANQLLAEATERHSAEVQAMESAMKEKVVGDAHLEQDFEMAQAELRESLAREELISGKLLRLKRDLKGCQHDQDAYANDLSRVQTIVSTLEKLRKDALVHFGLPEKTNWQEFLLEMDKRNNAHGEDLRRVQAESDGHQARADQLTAAIQAAASRLNFDLDQGLDTFLANVAPAYQAQTIQAELEDLKSQGKALFDGYMQAAIDLNLPAADVSPDIFRNHINHLEFELNLAQTRWNTIADALEIDHDTSDLGPTMDRLKSFIHAEEEDKAEDKYDDLKVEYDELEVKYDDLIDDYGQVLEALGLKNLVTSHVDEIVRNINASKEDEEDDIQLMRDGLNHIMGSFHHIFVDKFNKNLKEPDLYEEIYIECERLLKLDNSNNDGGYDRLMNGLRDIFGKDWPTPATTSRVLQMIDQLRKDLAGCRTILEKLRGLYLHWYPAFNEQKQVPEDERNDIDDFWDKTARDYQQKLQAFKTLADKNMRLLQENRSIKKKLDECEVHRRGSTSSGGSTSVTDSRRGSISQIAAVGSAPWQKVQQGTPASGSSGSITPIFGSGANSPHAFNFQAIPASAFSPLGVTSPRDSGTSTPNNSAREQMLTSIRNREQRLRDLQRADHLQPWDQNQGVNFANMRRSGLAPASTIDAQELEELKKWSDQLRKMIKGSAGFGP